MESVTTCEMKRPSTNCFYYIHWQLDWYFVYTVYIIPS